MRCIARVGTVLALSLVLPLPLAAQNREGLTGDLMKDVDEVQKKIVGLASAMPAEAFAWRPGDGVRSSQETLLHVAADNYFIPALMGVAPPAESGIDGKDYKTTLAFEKKTMTREQVVAELEKSFAFLEKSLDEFPAAKMEAPLEVFGQKMTNRRMWLMATTHLHEHLGQLIAYARMNKVTPPWSK